ncbi:MAG: methylated-DNA--[protein]-cysteine S-methyltransferase [Cyclobacteriaceae bacterium]
MIIYFDMLVTNQNQIEIYYRALLERRQDFAGIFFVGVKTTSVFCISTCRARKPKAENVEFYTTFKEAIDNGYRPCKICKPTGNAHQAPELVQRAIDAVKENPKKKITDLQLEQQGIRPEMVRRWFQKHYGMTFQAYQRMYRINNAFQELKKGKNVTHTAFDNSYESLSGFGYTFKKLMGNSPKNIEKQEVILIDRLTTPLGPMFACATERGLCLLEFVDRRMLETEFRDLQKLLNARIITGENQHINQVKKELSEYFAGKRKDFDVHLETPGSEFQKQVWNSLLSVPFGTTSTYQQQAESIGSPKAARAVASANGSNRVSIIVPCHRIIGKNGRMTGYGGGIERKKWLIRHEEKYG